MSKIHEIAVAIRDCTRVALAADRRVEMLQKFGDNDRIEDGPMVSILIMHAERVRDDSCLMRNALEEELTLHVPQDPADALTQLAVAAYYYHGFDLAYGSSAERVVRLLIGRVLEGLISMAGANSTPAVEVYKETDWIWPDRVKEIEDPLAGNVVPGFPVRKPFRAA